MNERLDMQNIIWASVYGASFALEMRSHLSLGRELTDKDVERPRLSEYGRLHRE